MGTFVGASPYAFLKAVVSATSLGKWTYLGADVVMSSGVRPLYFMARVIATRARTTRKLGP